MVKIRQEKFLAVNVRIPCVLQVYCFKKMECCLGRVIKITLNAFKNFIGGPLNCSTFEQVVGT